jgi:uncharacterized membrane-anchored protein YhcB (DUF1043 family)
MKMTQNRWVALAIVGLVLAFLIGFVPSWSRARALDSALGETRSELETTRFELDLYQVQGRLGAALAEAQRSNYERSRQLMTQVFSGLQANLPRMTDPDRRQAAELILAQRDEIITQLSRAEPESVQRLMLLYTHLFAVVDPLGRDAPAPVTPTEP